jgi:Kef-type K+ transport system membrane component KefB
LLTLAFSFFLFFSLLQEQNKDTGRKLGITTVLMCTLPILSYYLGLYLFANKNQPDSWAGGMAILMTNVIVAGYVISAFQEKEEDVTEQPRVGAFIKTRTD